MVKKKNSYAEQVWTNFQRVSNNNYRIIPIFISRVFFVYYYLPIFSHFQFLQSTRFIRVSLR